MKLSKKDSMMSILMAYLDYFTDLWEKYEKMCQK